jgi:antitoxin (DNA-binding transcriptional repressor) of toxin-antitoxin stability system
MRERSAMDTVSIRDLRGKSIREHADSGKPLAITNWGALVAVIIPVAAAWVEHIIDYNWSRVRQSIAEGEQAISTGIPMTPIGDLAVDDPADPSEEAAAQSVRTSEVVRELQAAWNPAAAQKHEMGAPPVRTVRIGDLTAGLIEKASMGGETIALTHERKLIGIVIPVTRGLVEFLLEQNMSRVFYNIGLGEKQLATSDQMVTTSQILAEDDDDQRDAPGAGKRTSSPGDKSAR